MSGLAAAPVLRSAARRPDGANPHRARGSQVQAGGVTWHVQSMGEGPPILLVHGTGAAGSSFADLMPLLAPRFKVLAIDLPGHGGSTALPWSRSNLEGIGEALAELLETLALRPAIGVGHSAGAAILAWLAIGRRIAPAGLVSLAGALLPLPGWIGAVFSPAARLLVLNPLVPRLFAWGAGDPAALRRLVAGTGSRLSGAAMARYAALVRDPAHVAGALAMMAGWELGPLQRRLPELPVPLVAVWAGNDRTLPPAEPERLHALLPGARRIDLPGLGHLAHEERPDLVAGILADCAIDWGVVAN